MAEGIRRRWISEQTFYRWNGVFGGLASARQDTGIMLENENRQLETDGCELDLYKFILPGVLATALGPYDDVRSRTSRRPMLQANGAVARARRRAFIGVIHIAQAGQDAAGEAHPLSGGDADVICLCPIYKLLRVPNYDNGVTLKCSLPKIPADNAHVGAFDGRLCN